MENPANPDSDKTPLETVLCNLPAIFSILNQTSRMANLTKGSPKHVGRRIAGARRDGFAVKPLDTNRVQAALAGCAVGHRIRYRRSVGSTMDLARDLAKRGAAEGATVVAEEQTTGRGRFDRAWVSPPFQNLYLTVALRPDRALLPSVNMAATLATRQTAADVAGASPAVKWPNDVRIDGRKLAGILIEAEFEGGEPAFALVGIGLNVNLDVSRHPEIAETAASLRSVSGREFERESVLESLLRNLDEWLRRAKSGEPIAERWADSLETLGKRVRLRWKERVVEGIAESVDERGGLVVLRDDGIRQTVAAGEVTSQI